MRPTSLKVVTLGSSVSNRLVRPYRSSPPASGGAAKAPPRPPKTAPSDAAAPAANAARRTVRREMRAPGRPPAASLSHPSVTFLVGAVIQLLLPCNDASNYGLNRDGLPTVREQGRHYGHD